MQEALECFRFREPLQDALLCVKIGCRLIDPAFDAFADPVAHFVLVDVHVFEADAVAIRAAQAIDHLTERHGLCPFIKLGFYDVIEICFTESKFAQLQARLRRWFRGKWVGPGGGVADGAVGVNQADDFCTKCQFLRGHAAAERFRSGACRASCGSTSCRFLGELRHSKLEALKKCGPSGFDRAWVKFPLREFLIEKFAVQPRGNVGTHSVPESAIVSRIRARAL